MPLSDSDLLIQVCFVSSSILVSQIYNETLLLLSVHLLSPRIMGNASPGCHSCDSERLAVGPWMA
jgi:hypothetical protein